MSKQMEIIQESDSHKVFDESPKSDILDMEGLYLVYTCWCDSAVDVGWKSTWWKFWKIWWFSNDMVLYDVHSIIRKSIYDQIWMILWHGSQLKKL